MQNLPEKLRVLVIEDDELDRLIIGKALQGTNRCEEVAFAEDTESGLKALEGKSYNFIFLDYNLPGNNGLYLLRKIREAGISIPVVVVTSQGDDRIAVDLMKGGASDYIPKNTLTTERATSLLNNYMFNQGKDSQSGEIAVLVSTPIEMAENLTLVFKIKDLALHNYINKPYKAEELLKEIAASCSNKSISLTVHNNTEKTNALAMDENNDIIDLEYLKRVAENEADFIRDMIAIFLKRTPDAVATIRLALADGNSELVWQTAHRIKPTFSYMGMTATSALAARLEKLYKTAPDKILAEELLTTIENNFRTAQSLIEKEFLVTK